MASCQRSIAPLVAAVLAAILPAGCAASRPVHVPVWQVALLRVIDGLNIPECVVIDPQDGAAYVSNIEAAPDEYWTDDGRGFIARLTPAGQLDPLRWRNSTPPGALLNGPKGLCIDPTARLLYVADNKRVVLYFLGQTGAKGDRQRVVADLHGERFSDMAFDGSCAYVSDTAANKIYKLTAPPCQVKSPISPNGLTFFNGRMFAVSWDLHEVYELDAAGRDKPRPFGLAAHFTHLDGIAALDDGAFLVSDFTGSKVCLIAPDRKTVRTLIEVESPADIGLDRTRGLLYVPQFMKNQVAVYRLEKK